MNLDVNNKIVPNLPNSPKISTIFLDKGSGRQPKVFIKTFGCQMNEYDSGVVANELVREGYEIGKDEDEASVVVVNTCSVRQHAEDRACGYLREIVRAKKERKPEEKKDIILVVMGCMAQREGERLLKIIPEIDIICGVDSFRRLPEMLKEVKKNGTKYIDCSRENSTAEREDGELARGECSLPRHSLKGYVAVMRGCNNCCSYCVVPEARGRERSRPVSEISDEVKKLVDKGVREVTLLGQNITAYGRDNGRSVNLVKLLTEVNKIPGLYRIRFITSHPRDTEPGLFQAMRDLEKVTEYLHLPIQAGSDRILKLMNRGYTVSYYKELVEKLRSILPEVCLGTDFIVGFPGESEEDFQETLKVSQEIGFDLAYMYKYSQRPGTKAFDMPGEVPKEVIEERHQKLLKLQEKISLNKNQALIGKEEEVLVEGRSKRNKERLSGRDGGNRIVVFEGKDELIGKIVTVKVTRGTSLTLYGGEKKAEEIAACGS